MRGAMWMALALLGTPLAALAQTRATAEQQPVAAPSGAASIEQGQDSVRAPGSFGVFGGPAIPGLGGVPMADPPQTAPWWQGGTGGSGMSDSIGPTYRGTTPMTPAPAPSDTVGTQPGSVPSTTTPAPGSTTPAPGSTTNPSSGTQAQAAPANSPAPAPADVSTLSQRVDALEREVSTLRGTGGGGTEPSTAAPTTAPAAAPAAESARSDDAEPVAVVTVEFDGTVRDVSSKHIDVVDRTDGTLSRLTIDDQTRAYRGSKRISVKQIPEGARVRTSFAYISGVEHARDIVVQSSPRRSQQ